MTSLDINFPTLGGLQDLWVEAHCVVPDGFDAGKPFRLSAWQLEDVANHYRVKPDARLGQLAPAFYYRRSLIARPQKVGKGPFTAAVVCLEAVGPALFAGWAAGGERWDCREHDCGCGFVYVYQPGEPMAMSWPTPLIQITATSEEQTDNIYGALRPMIEKGPLGLLIPKTGEEFIRLPNDGRIDIVTSNARSRLGQRVTFCPQDETGIWTAETGMVKVAETQRRGLAGMGGRAMETTNAWDPSVNSVAQRTFESRSTDIYRDFPQAPKHLSYRNKAERKKIHAAVYAGSPWVDLDAIEGEAAELLEVDPQQAERFFGNRLVYALGTWLPEGRWDASLRDQAVPPLGTVVCAGFDGSENNDCTAIRLETLDGWQFTPTYGPDNRPTIWNPTEWPDGEIPRVEVRAAWDEIMHRYKVRRAYCDPQGWRTEIEELSLAHGEKVVLEWATNRPAQMHESLKRFETDLKTGKASHDACPTTAVHVANARKLARPGQRYILGKPTDHQKIDAAMASALAHEATCDAIADGPPPTGRARGKTHNY